MSLPLRLLHRRRILGDREAELREAERQLLERLAAALLRFGADLAQADAQRLRDASAQLAELFLIVIAGEFNSGKSSFINALLGERVLPEGVTPTTDRINVLRHGLEPGERLLADFLLERTHPSPILAELNIVDTPGTNAIIRRHEELTRDFIPRSDLVLFVTSADRPFTESERMFLEQIREWGKKIVIILNKMDILQVAEVEQVVDFIRTHATALLGVTPEVFPVSSRSAQQARQSQNELIWAATGFQAVEKYLLETLDQEARVRLKLLNPMGVALKLAGTYRSAADTRLETLSDDAHAIQNIEGQLTVFRAEMIDDLRARIDRIERILQEMQARGDAFFDAHIQVREFRGLLSPEVLQEQFQREVVGPIDQEIDAEVNQLIDWMIERNLKLWQDVNTYLDRRRLTRHRDEMVGEVGQSFHYNRQSLLETVGSQVERVVSGYNREAEAAQLGNELRSAVTTTALTGAGAVGLGALLVALLHGALADFTGILLATTLAVGGLYVIPARRRQVKRDFRHKIDTLRDELTRSLTRQTHQEIDAAMGRVNEAISPYTRFVKFQLEELGSSQRELREIEASLHRLKGEIEGDG